MSQKSKAQHFTEEQIERFRNDPNVRDVKENTLRFTYEFRIKLYEAWEKEKLHGIRECLVENGYDLKELGSKMTRHLNEKFKIHGHPSNAKHNYPVYSNPSYRTSPEDNEYLLNTGRFIRSRNGIAFSDDFRDELYRSYPEQSIEEGIRKAGIDPIKVGYQRIYLLQKLFDGGGSGSVTVRSVVYSDEIIEKYKDHPYVQSITSKQLRLTRMFYNEASFLIELMMIDEILELYEIDPEDIPISVKINLKHRLNHWKKTEARRADVSEQMIRIQYRRYQKLFEIREERLRKIRETELPAMDCSQKKMLCYFIQSYPKDPHGLSTTDALLKKIGISKSCYYSILRSHTYGQSQYNKDKKDEEDIEKIKRVMDYKGFRKGSRQIYMDMKDITGEQFGLKKIRRLMKKYDIHSGIRTAKQSRIEARKNLETHKKPNVLKRQFRMARPNTIVLSDVTYIDYGDGHRAYGSAAIDSVTGRIYDFTISDTNNMDLVLSTAASLSNVSFKANAVFHTDQGALYLTDTFQNKITDLSFVQSMSKRGNCWDNAPQESFFGHFKDECDYRNCHTLLELQCKCREYFDYYNKERRQWDRKKMTPLQYEKYMNEMNEDDFAAYMENEKKKYEAMKERAAEEAQNRAKTLGV